MVVFLNSNKNEQLSIFRTIGAVVNFAQEYSMLIRVPFFLGSQAEVPCSCSPALSSKSSFRRISTCAKNGQPTGPCWTLAPETEKLLTSWRVTSGTPTSRKCPALWGGSSRPRITGISVRPTRESPRTEWHRSRYCQNQPYLIQWIVDLLYVVIKGNPIGSNLEFLEDLLLATKKLYLHTSIITNKLYTDY